MRFNATKKQVQIFRLAAVAYEKLGDVTSKNLESLGCSALQVDGRRGHVLYISETLGNENHVDMNAEHRIAARAALELHKREIRAAEKKNEQLELVDAMKDSENRLEAIDEFLADIDEQLELQPEAEEESLGSLDEFIADNGDPSEALEKSIAEEFEPESVEDDGESVANVESPLEPGQTWTNGAGRSFMVGKGNQVHDITDLSDTERKNLRRSIRRPSRAGKSEPKNRKSRKQAKRK